MQGVPCHRLALIDWLLEADDSEREAAPQIDRAGAARASHRPSRLLASRQIIGEEGTPAIAELHESRHIGRVQ